MVMSPVDFENPWNFFFLLTLFTKSEEEIYHWCREHPSHQMAGAHFQPGTLAENATGTNHNHHQESKMEMDWTHLAQRAEQHPPPYPGLEPARQAQEGQTSQDLAQNAGLRVENHPHVLGRSEEGSPRSRQVEACSDGPMFQWERRGLSK